MQTFTFTLEQIEEGIAEQLGFCIHCGAERACCEPDARNYECEDCGYNQVFGAQELLFMGLIKED